MTTVFHFIRHGEIPSNALGILPSPEESLTDAGRAQAVESAKALEAVLRGPSHLYCSPMPRATETALGIYEQLKFRQMVSAPVVDDRLAETSFGDLVGLTWAQVDAKFPKENLSRSYVDQTYDFSSHGGGSFEELKTRLYLFIHDMKERHPGEEVTVVAHGGIIRCVYKIEENTTFDKVPDNASIHTFEL